MRQEINLYQAELKPQRVPFAARQALTVVVLALVAIAAVYAYRYTQVAPLEHELAGARDRLATAEARVARLRETHPPASVDPALKDRLKARRAKLENTRDIAEKLRSGEFGSVDGLSGYLEGFARRHVDGTWLTAVHVQRGGRVLGFEGKTLAPELVPTYLDGLREEALFDGRNFSALSMTTADAAVSAIDFRVNTTGYVRPEAQE